MSSKKHQWTEEEDQALCEIVDTLDVIRDQYKYQKDFWAAVAHGLAYKEQIVVSADACRHRWQGLQPKDKWEVVVEMAENYERELLEDLEHNLSLVVAVADNHLAHIRTEIEAIGGRVDWLARELGWGQQDAPNDDYAGDHEK